MNSRENSFPEDLINPGDGRCEDCLRKLVFMTQCEALNCGRWVCEHKLIRKRLIKNPENLKIEKSIDKPIEFNFCSYGCSCDDIDFYLAQLRYNLQKSRKI